MFYIYVIKSKKDNDLYIGFTHAPVPSSGTVRGFAQRRKPEKKGATAVKPWGSTNNLERRIKEHNNGLVPSTKFRKPFDFIYCEGYKSEKGARKREQNLKLRSRAFTQLKRRISDSLK